MRPVLLQLRQALSSGGLQSGVLLGLEYGGRQPILDPDETRMVDQNDVHG